MIIAVGRSTVDAFSRLAGQLSIAQVLVDALAAVDFDPAAVFHGSAGHLIAVAGFKDAALLHNLVALLIGRAAGLTARGVRAAALALCAKLVLTANPACATAAIIPAILLRAFRDANANAFSAQLLCAVALPATATATIIPAILVLAIGYTSVGGLLISSSSVRSVRNVGKHNVDQNITIGSIGDIKQVHNVFGRDVGNVEDVRHSQHVRHVQHV